METLTLIRPWGTTSAKVGIIFLPLFLIAFLGLAFPWLLRMAIPSLLLMIYLGIAIFRNQITTTIAPDAITIEVGPLPAARKRILLKPEIDCVYGRTTSITVEGKEHHRHNHTGVITLQREAVDLTDRQPDRQHAVARARTIAAILGVDYKDLGHDKNPDLPTTNKLLWVRYFTIAAIAGLPLLLI